VALERTSHKCALPHSWRRASASLAASFRHHRRHPAREIDETDNLILKIDRPIGISVMNLFAGCLMQQVSFLVLLGGEAFGDGPGLHRYRPGMRL